VSLLHQVSSQPVSQSLLCVWCVPTDGLRAGVPRSLLPADMSSSHPPMQAAYHGLLEVAQSLLLEQDMDPDVRNEVSCSAHCPATATARPLC
jgi:hypothetical protein